MSKVLVIALGGNALGNTPNEMNEVVSKTISSLLPLIKKGYKLVITHGNGPQVGTINDELLYAKINNNASYFPLSLCNAMSQSYISYYLQSCLIEALESIKSKLSVVNFLTLTEVAKNDPALKKPTKPIGPFYKTAYDAKQAVPKDSVIKFFEGKGFRQVVASPKPVNIYNVQIIKKLLENNNIVICGGGGGVPYYLEKNKFHYVEGVIDKDLSSSKIAQLLKADNLIILTNVDNVYLNYGKSTQIKLNVLKSSQITSYIKKGYFGVGDMLPKILACKEFSSKTNKESFIGSINNLANIISKKAGTVIKK